MQRRTIAAALASIALCVCAGSSSSCRTPGKGAKAEAGYNNARPVIDALRRYRDKHKEYPATLRDLVPEDLTETDWKTSDGKPVDQFFEYQKTAASYQLQFSYTGPGMNLCVFTPESAKWECAGRY